MKKSRFFFLHPGCNTGKISSLNALQRAYTAYLQVCVDSLLESRCFSVSLSEKRAFFPPSSLSSQISKNVQDHAIGIVSGWAASLYQTKLKQAIKNRVRSGEIREDLQRGLFTIGKNQVRKPGKAVTQEAIDLYWSLLLDETVSGRKPAISDRCGMRLSEMTSVLGQSDDTALASWWLAFSHLEAGKARIALPLSANPYVNDVRDVSKGILARKTKNGVWRFEVVEKKEWETPAPYSESEYNGQPFIGVDIGLNVLASTSDGTLYGTKVKPVFDALYGKVKKTRANRARQGLREDSKRLSTLESRLSGFVRTETGKVANLLVKSYPGYVFVVEDLNLKGCRGQKRFAYKALHASLATKACCFSVNPAYTSQYSK